MPARLLPSADEIEITAADDGYYLFRYTESGEPVGDSWFSTIDEALRQAEFEFGVEQHDWRGGTLRGKGDR